jgi:ABC-type uncharacterized transport system substrate-binding protein
MNRYQPTAAFLCCVVTQLDQAADLAGSIDDHVPGEVCNLTGPQPCLGREQHDHSVAQLPALAADLVRRQITVITAEGVASALVAKAATTTVPIVFYFGGDPVELGLVASLNRPGGNLTGVTPLNTALGPKRLQLLHELVPTAGTIALLVNPTGTSSEGQLRDLPGAARTIGVQLHVLRASSERDFDRFFAAPAHVS